MLIHGNPGDKIISAKDQEDKSFTGSVRVEK